MVWMVGARSLIAPQPLSQVASQRPARPLGSNKKGPAREQAPLTVSGLERYFGNFCGPEVRALNGFVADPEDLGVDVGHRT